MKSEDISNNIIEQIKNGDFLPNQKIPSEKELSDAFSASRMTVRKGIEMAVNRGYLYTLQGKGTYVIDESQKEEINIFDNTSFTDRAQKLGRRPSTQVLSIGSRPSNAYINHIFKTELEEIFYMERVRYVEDIPLAVEYCYIRPDYISDISIKDVTSSFSQYIHSKNIPITKVKKEFKAVIPTNEIISALQLNANTPVIRVDFYRTLENDQLLEYAKVFYNQSLFKFVQEIQF